MIQEFDALAFEVKHAADYERSFSFPIEVDDDGDYSFGQPLNRVWYGRRILGTFYRQGDYWLANHHYSFLKTYHGSPDEATKAIANVYKEAIR